MNQNKPSLLTMAATLVASLVVTPQAFANLIAVEKTLIGVTSRVYSIDTATGTPTLIGNSGIAQLQSLAHSPDGTYYATAAGGGGGPVKLVTIDPTTGAGTTIGTVTTTDPAGISAMQGLAFGADGTLYGAGTALGSTISNLYSVNRTTGVASLIGSTNATSIQGLDFNDAKGVLYAYNGNGDAATRGLRTVNTTTGASTFIGPVGGSGTLNLASIAFTPDGTLWGSNTSGLWTINPATGVAVNTYPGTTFHLGSYSGLEYLTPVPVPAAVWLFGSGLAAMAGWLRRRTVSLSA